MAGGFAIPTFTQPVVDEAQLVNTQATAFLNAELSRIYQIGGPQIGVLTVSELDGQTIEERAIQVFDDWKIGKQGKDNGILVVVAREERKIRIEVGRGLEGDIPDAYAKRIIEDVMIPFFRNGKTSFGIVAGVQQIVQLSGFELQGYQATTKDSQGDFSLGQFIFIMVFFLLVLALNSSLRAWG